MSLPLDAAHLLDVIVAQKIMGWVRRVTRDFPGAWGLPLRVSAAGSASVAGGRGPLHSQVGAERLIVAASLKPAEQPSKRRRVENSLPLAGAGPGVDEAKGLPEKPAPVDVGPPSRQKEKAASLKRDVPKVPHDSSKDSITVFVSNLPYSMGEPEAKLRPLFEACGEVVEIRPIFSNRGDFRGYCYVQFKEEQSALKALELDRKDVEGRPMFVSPCVDKSKNPDFKVCYGGGAQPVPAAPAGS